MRRFFRWFLHFLCCLALLTSSLAQDAAQMPKIEGESFAGKKVVLPDAAAGKVAVLVFGFTKASKGPTTAWANKLLAVFGTRPEFVLYQLPVLEDVPRLIRGMVIGGIKKGVPEKRRDHFVAILQREAELKKFVHYNEPDDAYLVVLSRAGNTLALSHGAPTIQTMRRCERRLNRRCSRNKAVLQL
jgi:hypothetical protein